MPTHRLVSNRLYVLVGNHRGGNKHEGEIANAEASVTQAQRSKKIDSSKRSFVKGAVAALCVPGVTNSVMGQIANATSKSQDVDHNNWWQGDISHLLPMVNHERLLLKVSFQTPLNEIPYLDLGGRVIAGCQSDTHGRFWQFHADGLESAVEYSLQFVTSSLKPLCDPWPIQTFPHPEDEPEHVRLLMYTCAGGDEAKVTPDGRPEAISKVVRRQLFARGLSFEPDAVIGIGDQVYLDIKSGIADPVYGDAVRAYFDEHGWFDNDLPVLGSKNESLLAHYVDRQIGQLYGVMFRSTPTYLTMDDHDYFENDVANNNMVTFPVDSFQLRLARTTQQLYFPEFLPDQNRPLGLSGSSAGDRAEGLSESFGTLRYGKLLELLMYDCRRFMDLKGELSRFVAADAEDWLISRTGADDTSHLIHVPSTPMGWSAGKWAEWYPDVLDGKTLTIEKHKHLWQPGWFAQHQRILKSLYAQTERPPVMISGDLHAIAYSKIMSSGDLSFDDNPIHTILAGPIGTEDEGYPSFYRGVGGQPPQLLSVEEVVKPIEKLGFSILDITKNNIKVRQFAWRPPEEETHIDTLQPFSTIQISRNKA